MSVAVFYGEESFLLEHAVQALRQQVVNPAMASLCHRILHKPSIADVLEAVGAVSMALGGQTLLEIRDFTSLHQAAKDPATETQLEDLRALLEAEHPNKVVLFVSSKVDGKIKFAKWLTKHTQFDVRKFEAFKFWETDKVVGFIEGYARQHGIQLPAQAAEQLVATCGTELRVLAAEVDKLALFANGRPITPQDVTRCTHHVENLFRTVDRWILRHQTTENFTDMAEALLRRHPVELFATMQSYFTNLFRVMYWAHQGVSADVIAQRTGQKPFTVKKHLQTFRNVPITRWTHLKQQLVDLEWKAKTGQLESQLALEVLMSA